MRPIPQSLRTTLLLALTTASPSLALSTYANAASPNLNGRLTSVNVTKESDGSALLTFAVEVRNSGDAPAAGSFRVKPFLVARDDAAAALVLPNFDTSLALEAGSEKRFEYRTTVANLPQRVWYLGAVLNPAWTIAENGPRYRYDNTPDLVSLGSFGANATGLELPPEPGIDLYPRVVDGHELSWGRVTHALRAIGRGPRPLQNFQSDQLRALFGVIDFDSKKVTLLDYRQANDPENPEKAWYAISWNPERDARDAELSVDYYTNNIAFGHVPPGTYRFFTLLNSQDRVPEKNTADNLETLPLNLSLATTPKQSVIYAATKVTNGPAHHALLLRGNYPANAVVRGEITSATTALNFSPISAALGEEAEVAVDFPALPVGDYSAQLRLTSALTRTSEGFGPFTEFRDIPVRVWVFGDETPKLERSVSDLPLFAHQEKNSEVAPLTLRNTGTADLVYSLTTDKAWIALSQNSGVIPPGGSTTIGVQALANANLGTTFLSYVEGNIYFQTNTLEDESASPVVVKLQTRN